MNLTNAEPWTHHAACIACEPDDWYPHTGQRAIAAEATAICRQCPVATQCLAYALDNFTYATDHGIWGATSPDERRALRAQRSKAKKGAA